MLRERREEKKGRQNKTSHKQLIFLLFIIAEVLICEMIKLIHLEMGLEEELEQRLHS